MLKEDVFVCVAVETSRMFYPRLQREERANTAEYTHPQFLWTVLPTSALGVSSSGGQRPFQVSEAVRIISDRINKGINS